MRRPTILLLVWSLLPSWNAAAAQPADKARPGVMFGLTFGASGYLTQFSLKNASRYYSSETASGFGPGGAVRGGLLLAGLDQAGHPTVGGRLGLELAGFGVPVSGTSIAPDCRRSSCESSFIRTEVGGTVALSVGLEYSIPLFSADGEGWRNLTIGLDYKPSIPPNISSVARPPIAPLGGGLHAIVGDFYPQHGTWNLRIDAGFLHLAGDRQENGDPAGGHLNATIFTIGIGVEWLPPLPGGKASSALPPVRPSDV